jgi:hypothetical protein
MTNSIHPLFRQGAMAAMVPVKRIRKLSTTINVEFVVRQKIFGRHEQRKIALSLSTTWSTRGR